MARMITSESRTASSRFHSDRSAAPIFVAWLWTFPFTVVSDHLNFVPVHAL